MSRREGVTLTRDQEERLVKAFELIVEAETVPVLAQPGPTSFWRRPMVVPTLAFLTVLAVFLPLRLAGNDIDAEPTDVSAPAQEPAATTLPVTPAPDSVEAGEASQVEGGTVGSDLVVYGDAFYTVGVGEVDRILRSIDQGRTWEPVLTADPGDAEGLFAVGDLVVQVVEDDETARDTVEPGSAVSDSPRALVYDPDTGHSIETALPRPDDPEMTGLPLDGSSGCALAGYQSWVRAEGVAVGDRLLVVGAHQLVGELATGEVICDNQAYRHLAWVSDDGGASWEIHEAPAVVSVAWTGDRFVGWSPPDDSGARNLLVSDDGVSWTVAATTPTAPEGRIAVGPPQLAVTGDRVIGLAEFHSFAADIPENVTNADDLREALGLGTDLGNDPSPAEILEMLGVDLPLDDGERDTIQKFNGSTASDGAVIAVSEDGGATWTVELVDEPLTGVAIAGDRYLALTTPSQSDSPSILLFSASGVEWSQLTELPIRGAGWTLAATADAVFVADVNSGALWTVPIQE